MPEENPSRPALFRSPSSYSFGREELSEARWLVERALEEDLRGGDRTTEGLLGAAGVLAAGRFPPAADLGLQAAFVARSGGVICGLPVVEDLFRRQAPEVMLSGKAKDGDRLPAAQRFLEVSGPARSILRLERIALNFVGRLSGIATGTARWVEKISGTRAKLFDTRKTTPGWRALEKYAVRVGGGHNHRRSLAEALLVKDNHVAVLRALGLWDVEACVRALRQAAPGLFLELEVASRDEFLAALRAGADAILLDNFDVPEVSWAVETRNRQPTAPGAPPGPLLEASGGIRLETVRAVAETGVERLSVGALTHSATSLDVALDFLGAYREGAG